ncbi:MAG TPA: GatB/YqeY domain-containing protein [Anaerolineales bacterium]|nr:GatB/YqeY domain-containing protein [Anaerolineales bacterium]
MDLKTQLSDAMKQAMKANDDVARRTTRMALAAIKQTEIDKRTTLDDAAVTALLQKEIKNRREAIEEARKADRADLVADNEAEIKVLEAFLPKAMSPEELRALAQAAVAETGATSQSDMGKVMKALMPRVAGRAAGDQVSAVVKELLTGQA